MHEAAIINIFLKKKKWYQRSINKIINIVKLLLWAWKTPIKIVVDKYQYRA